MSKDLLFVPKVERCFLLISIGIQRDCFHNMPKDEIFCLLLGMSFQGNYLKNVPKVEYFCLMLSIQTQRFCFHNMPKVESFCVLLSMVSHRKVIFSWHHQLLNFKIHSDFTGPTLWIFIEWIFKMSFLGEILQDHLFLTLSSSVG